MNAEFTKSFLRYGIGLAFAIFLFNLLGCDLLDSEVRAPCYTSDAPLTIVGDSTALVGDWDFSYLTYPDRASCRKWTQETLGYSIAWTFTESNWSYRNLDGRINADGFWSFQNQGDSLSFSIPDGLCKASPIDIDENRSNLICQNEFQVPWFNHTRDSLIVDKTHIPLDGRRLVFVRRG